jgi:hypothetical protein
LRIEREFLETAARGLVKEIDCFRCCCGNTIASLGRKDG